MSVVMQAVPVRSPVRMQVVIRRSFCLQLTMLGVACRCEGSGSRPGKADDPTYFAYWLVGAGNELLTSGPHQGFTGSAEHVVHSRTNTLALQVVIADVGTMALS
eukprot:COSAG06_NODE_5887_length_3228_cov_14.702461_3_plen_104_part_00